VALGSLVGLLIKAVPALDQANLQVVALTLPVNISVALVLWRSYRAATTGAVAPEVAGPAVSATTT